MDDIGTKKAGRLAINTIIPGRLYQRGQFLTWPAAQKWRLLEQHQITLVVNLWSKVDPDLSTPKVGWRYLTWVCSPSELPNNYALLINFIVSVINTGGVGLIHCEAGRGRSVWLSTRVAAAVLKLSLPEALSMVEKAVPGHNLTKTLRHDLLQDDIVGCV